MLISLPDPHPGRCLNFRRGNRCLDYDLHKGACRFADKKDSPYDQDMFRSVDYSWSPKEPEPWKSPLEDA